MFEGNVRQIKRNKLIHCGVRILKSNETFIISVCNGTWDWKDKVSEGNASKVTCKRCRKLLDKADSEGMVTL